MAAFFKFAHRLGLAAMLALPTGLGAQTGSASAQATASTSEAAAAYLGQWRGTLRRGNTQSAIELSLDRLGQTEGGTFTWTGLGYVNSTILGSRILDDGRARISLPLPLGAIRLSVARKGDRLEGTLEEIAQVAGEFKELGPNGTVELTRAGPFGPMEGVQLSVPSDGATLSGTLYKPSGPGPFPAAIYVHGSGDVDRTDATLLARRLNAKGVALFAYDKRGVGKSTGDWKKGSLELLAADALAALKVVSARSEIDPRRVGYIGRSQGGWIVPIALRGGGAAFAAFISGPSVSTADEDLDHYVHVFEEAGMTRAELTAAEQLLRLNHKRMRGTATPAQVRAAAAKSRSARWFKLLDWDSIEKNETPFDRAWIAYDPERDLRRLDIPTLWMFGTDDKVIPVQASVDRLIRLKMPRRPTIHIVAGGDHSLAVIDYPRLPTGVPEAFDAIGDWINSNVKPAPADPR